MSNILSRKFWRQTAGLIALALGLGDGQAEIFRTTLKPGASVTHTVSTVTVVQPIAYEFSVLKPFEFGMHYQQLSIYSRRRYIGATTFWDAVAEYKLTADASAAPGEYVFVGQFRFYLSAYGPGQIGSVTFTNIVTIPAPCSYSVSAAGAEAEAIGGAGSFAISSEGNCGWTASTADSWITIEQGASGVGSGTISYSVAANTNLTSRSATIKVADRSFVIKQAGWQPRFTMERMGDGRGQLTVFGRTGVRHVVEASVDLKKWTLFLDFTMEGTSRSWVLPNEGKGLMFFRAREVAN